MNRADARAAPRQRGPGTASVACGALGLLSVVAAVVLAVRSAPDMVGLALVSVGLVLALAGLVVGTIGAVHERPRGGRLAVSGAGLSVVGLAGGLVWTAVFVLTAVAGPAPAGLGPSVHLVPPAVSALPTCPGSTCSGDF
ncbi:hypothetical protein WIS52_00290 [Pseudonocardia nematodicida]|uniref:DUF4190 domain-containing protein n=1 Tax=Pseudonocardia nematodicida TaxID=1206997 RepID=A0ABV1K4Z6_9PSEU